MKAEGIPFNKVWDSSQEEPKVAVTLPIIAAVRKRAAKREPTALPWIPVRKNKVIRVKRVGNRPLQGTRELVRIAIRRSLGESIIRHPMEDTLNPPAR